jgi:TetR/AcrR family transcriptional regulator
MGTNSRDRQREETRDRIVAAAVECFAERGFRAASTREIASRAGTNQGLITYHFRSKDELWKAAADQLFGGLREQMAERLSGALEMPDPRERTRAAIREFVRFAGEHPELFRFMLEAGKSDDERMGWLVDTHLRPAYEANPQFGLGVAPELRPHIQYILVGAASVIFAVAPECRRLTGLDPRKRDAIERHADVVAQLLVP